MRLMGEVSALLVALAAGVPGVDPARASEECRETRDVRTTVKQALSGPDDYTAAREKASREAVVAAVNEALGAQVKSWLQVTALQVDDKVTDRMTEVMATKTGGRVESFRVVEEAVEGDDDLRLLRLTIEASVCVPALSELPAVLVAGSVTAADGTARDDLRLLLLAAAQDSQRLVMVDAPPETSYHDFLVAAQILEAGSAIIDNSERIDLLARMAGPAAANRIPRQARRVVVVVAVRATEPGSQESVVESLELHRNIPPDADDAPVIAELIREGLTDAAKNVYTRLAAASSGK